MVHSDTLYTGVTLLTEREAGFVCSTLTHLPHAAPRVNPAEDAASRGICKGVLVLSNFQDPTLVLIILNWQLPIS